MNNEPIRSTLAKDITSVLFGLILFLGAIGCVLALAATVFVYGIPAFVDLTKQLTTNQTIVITALIGAYAIIKARR